MSQVIARVGLQRGKTAFFDERTRIHLTISRPEAPVFAGMNTSNLKRAVRSGVLRLLAGSLEVEKKELVKNMHHTSVAEDKKPEAPAEKKQPVVQPEPTATKVAEEPKETKEIVEQPEVKEEAKAEVKTAKAPKKKVKAEQDEAKEEIKEEVQEEIKIEE